MEMFSVSLCQMEDGTLIETKYQPIFISFFMIFFFANFELLMQKQINQNKFPTDNSELSRAKPGLERIFLSRNINKELTRQCSFYKEINFE